MTNEKILKIVLNEKSSGNDPVFVRDLRLLVKVVNQHSEYIEKLMQKVEELEKSIEELKAKETDDE